jgi:hypothetical protein
MTGTPWLILPAKHPKRNCETNQFFELSTLFSNNWRAQNEANFQAGRRSDAQPDPRIAPTVSDEDVGFAQVCDVQEDWPGKQGWIGPWRDLKTRACATIKNRQDCSSRCCGGLPEQQRVQVFCPAAHRRGNATIDGISQAAGELMNDRLEFDIVCPNNHNQTVTFSQEEFEEALKSGALVFHCNTCDTDWSPSSEEIAKLRKQLSKNSS